MASRETLQNFRVRIRNGAASRMEILLEPWGDSISLAEGEATVLTVTGPGDGELEIHREDDHVTILGWPGAVISPSKIP